MSELFDKWEDDIKKYGEMLGKRRFDFTIL